MKRFISESRPAIEDYQQVVDAIFTRVGRELVWMNEPAVIDGVKVMVSYQVDEDGYAGWTDNNRYTGVTHDPEKGDVFVEQFYPDRKSPLMVRYRANLPHQLVEKTAIIDGRPELIKVDDAVERNYRWSLLGASAVCYRQGLFGHLLDECIDYRKRTGSQIIAEFLKRCLETEGKL